MFFVFSPKFIPLQLLFFYTQTDARIDTHTHTHRHTNPLPSSITCRHLSFQELVEGECK